MSALIALAAASCSSEDSTFALEDQDVELGNTGAARLDLPASDPSIKGLTTVLTGPEGFEPQTHVIEADDTGVDSVLFGNLPVGAGYRLDLNAADCSGPASFQVDANQTTSVPVALSCAPEADELNAAGGLTIEKTLSRRCDLVKDIEAAPERQRGDSPISRVKLKLERKVSVKSVVWSTASITGGSGTLGSLSGKTDLDVTFDCATDGRVAIIATVTGSDDGRSCTQQARVTIKCSEQEPPAPAVCGDGTVAGAEQCDGAAGVGSCPAGTAGSVTCTAQCTRNTSACVPAISCGNGIVEGSEQCDGAAGVGSCPAGTTGTVTCSAQCTRNTSACVAEPPPLGACGICAAENCGLQRADVDANLASVDPIIACVLGDDWEAGGQAAATSCGNLDLLTCYCGSLSGQDCANAAPAALDGQCVPEVLAGTGCTTSSCVAPIFLSPANANGKAMQYIQCQQDFCYDTCFNP